MNRKENEPQHESEKEIKQSTNIDEVVDKEELKTEKLEEDEEVEYEDDEEELEEDVKKPEENKKSLLTFFIIFFPSIILSIIPSEINGSSIVAFGIKSCVLLLQLIILKNFVDTYYD